MTLREASSYWDKHDFFEGSEPREVEFDVEIRGVDHYVLLNSGVAKKVRTLARKKKTTERAVVNELLRKGLRHVA
jgi:hypothetical protein